MTFSDCVFVCVLTEGVVCVLYVESMLVVYVDMDVCLPVCSSIEAVGCLVTLSVTCELRVPSCTTADLIRDQDTK